ncbi:hypothetical protein DFH07DRAFT_773743 [Mycena maculata]|uniref:Uncharacterized protein n=1 Tax=Mycena maculata TaxID=230809 RepID=A0AAD7J095_9AGAR|nr:hypothetical protein DFH07DRAFT_773743 [Mycena maculata]
MRMGALRVLVAGGVGRRGCASGGYSVARMPYRALVYLSRLVPSPWSILKRWSGLRNRGAEWRRCMDGGASGARHRSHECSRVGVRGRESWRGCTRGGNIGRARFTGHGGMRKNCRGARSPLTNLGMRHLSFPCSSCPKRAEEHLRNQGLGLSCIIWPLIPCTTTRSGARGPLVQRDGAARELEGTGWASGDGSMTGR